MIYGRKYLLSFVATLALAACGEEPAESAVEESVVEKPALSTIDQRLSYMVGSNLSRQFKSDSVELDIDALHLGAEDVMAGRESRLSQEEIQDTIAIMQERGQKRQEELRAEQEKAQAEASGENKEEGMSYLAANKDKEGVVTTESGLQYKEIASGDGSIPTAEDTVSVHYKGTLIDGTVFDSSYDRGEPATFPVNGVIPGWVEALQLMNVGDKWELVIPSDIAYGPGGTGGAIGPNATLIFEVELLEIVEAE
ncbi:MAG: FKBP-type peptidyl-prolyl cis-trans isomerase [Cellvibrionaceae bacterium]|jgi:FKBP-type peptidyl-prolyl cis-trans isomerase